MIVAGGLAHAGAAALWWWLSPGGFDVGHARFLAGRSLPAVVLVVGLFASYRGWRHAALASWTATWCVGAVTALVLYDAGRLRIALGCAVPCGALLATCLAASLVGRSRWDARALFLALVGTGVGVAFPFAVRAPPASTQPLGDPAPRVTGTPVEHGRRTVGEGVRLDTRTAVVSVEKDGVGVRVQPLLRFWSRSPDRGWTLFARPRVRSADGTLRMTSAVLTEHGLRLFAQGVAEHVLDVRPTDPAAAILDSWAVLDAPEYAHQCSFASVSIDGLDAPRVELSVAPDVLIDVLPYDYPLGRPLRFATVGPDGVLRVLEASSGEKGPFRTLAEGPADTVPLTLTFHDPDGPRVRISLHDLASQASTELSPTAGWGVPQNDVSFSLDERTGEVRVIASWASTGIGRGFDTVGHAAGTYRNRIAVRVLR